MQPVDKIKQKIQELIIASRLSTRNPFDKVKEIKPQEPEK